MLLILRFKSKYLFLMLSVIHLMLKLMKWIQWFLLFSFSILPTSSQIHEHFVFHILPPHRHTKMNLTLKWKYFTGKKPIKDYYSDWKAIKIAFDAKNKSPGQSNTRKKTICRRLYSSVKQWKDIKTYTYSPTQCDFNTHWKKKPKITIFPYLFSPISLCLCVSFRNFCT